MFFETVEGDLIPVSRIQRIRKSFNQKCEWTVRLTDGAEVQIGLSAKASLECAPVASFSAAPGTEVLRVGGGEMFRYPVIGWVVQASGNALPVTIDGINDGGESDEYLPVLMSDGMVYKAEDPAYTLAEFKRLHEVNDAVISLDANNLTELVEFLEPHE